jgi:hypothetical protein
MKPFEAKVGDLVTPKKSSQYLTLGKVYEVVGLDDEGDIRVRDDDGVVLTRYARLFLILSVPMWFITKVNLMRLTEN